MVVGCAFFLGSVWGFFGGFSPPIMRFLTYNAGGLKGRGQHGQQVASWLLSLLDNGADIGALALQETHCRDDGELCQAVRDMGVRYTVVHSPAVGDDGYISR